MSTHIRSDQKTINRFLKYVDKRKGGCWLWTGGKAAHGAFYYLEKGVGAHRAAYMLFKGDIPKKIGLKKIYVCHTCDNPSCVNPKHLFLGTAKDNSDDRSIKKGVRKTSRWKKSHLLPEGSRRTALEALEAVMWDLHIAPSRVGREINGNPSFLYNLGDPNSDITTNTLDRVYAYILNKRGQLELNLDLDLDKD